MNLDLRHRTAATALVIVLLATASDQGQKAPIPEHAKSGAAAGSIRSAADMIARWPERPRALANMLLGKYGIPDEIVSSQLSWNDRLPWTKVVVFRDSASAGRSGHLLESVAYGKVPFDRWQDLTLLGRGAVYDPATQELSARTDGEGTNLLALNMADEVIQGRRSVADARRFYDATWNLSLNGKSSPYMSRLLFQPRSRTLPKLTGAGRT